MTTLERRIYVGGLHENMNEDILYSVFLTFGTNYETNQQ